VVVRLSTKKKKQFLLVSGYICIFGQPAAWLCIFGFFYLGNKEPSDFAFIFGGEILGGFF
jgi:hypothetical protein